MDTPSPPPPNIFSKIQASKEFPPSRAQFTTPPMLSIPRFDGSDDISPTFDTVSALPTPLVNCKPRSPMRSPPKHAGLRSMSPVRQQTRITSEYIPTTGLIMPRERVASMTEATEGNGRPEIPVQLEPTSPLSPVAQIIVCTDTDTGSPRDWHVMDQIGAGNYSKVYLARSMFEFVAIKVIKADKKDFKSDEGLQEAVQRELDILASVHHPCITKLIGINDPGLIDGSVLLRDTGHCDIVMPYCSGGDLLDLAMNQKLQLEMIQRLFTEIAHALQYIHKMDIVHRDIKLENFLINYPWRDLATMVHANCPLVTVTDFGLSRRIDPENPLLKTRCGSPDYVCPELMMGLAYDGKLCDSWALGVVLYALMESRLPFDPLPNAPTRNRTRSTAHRIARCEWSWYHITDEKWDAAKEIVEKTLVRNTHRWSTDDIVKSNWVNQCLVNLEFLKL